MWQESFCCNMLTHMLGHPPAWLLQKQCPPQSNFVTARSTATTAHQLNMQFQLQGQLPLESTSGSYQQYCQVHQLGV